jgi:general secretion pathway protein K
MSRSLHAPRPQGVALLLVMWLLVLLTGLVAVFALTARTEALQSRTLERSATARYAAEGGIEVAMLRMQDPDLQQHWQPDGRENRFGFDGYQVAVSVTDETGKIDINLAAPDLLTGLMLAVGIDQAKAERLAAAIVDWRDPDDLLVNNFGAEDPQYADAERPYGAKDRPFETVAELQQVLGFDADTYHALAQYFTVYTGIARPNAAFAPEPVLRAMGLGEAQVAQVLAQRAAWQPGLPSPTLPDGTVLSGQGSGTYSVSSRATRNDGTQAQVNAILRQGGGGAFGQIYTPLAWRVGETD